MAQVGAEAAVEEGLGVDLLHFHLVVLVLARVGRIALLAELDRRVRLCVSRCVSVCALLCVTTRSVCTQCGYSVEGEGQCERMHVIGQHVLNMSFVVQSIIRPPSPPPMYGCITPQCVCLLPPYSCSRTLCVSHTWKVKKNVMSMHAGMAKIQAKTTTMSKTERTRVADCRGRSVRGEV